MDIVSLLLGLLACASSSADAIGHFRATGITNKTTDAEFAMLRLRKMYVLAVCTFISVSLEPACRCVASCAVQWLCVPNIQLDLNNDCPRERGAADGMAMSGGLVMLCCSDFHMYVVTDFGRTPVKCGSQAACYRLG